MEQDVLEGEELLQITSLIPRRHPASNARQTSAGWEERCTNAIWCNKSAPESPNYKTHREKN